MDAEPQLMGVQLDITWEDRQTNNERVVELLSKTVVPPGSLVALPEMFASGFSMNVQGIHEREGQPTARFLADLARRLRCYIVGGLVTMAPDGRGRNEAVAIGPSGDELLRYQKIHPFRFAGETDHYEPGSVLALFDWNGFRTAVFICYDLRFPEVFRHAVRRGAQLFVVIANWPAAREEHWTLLLRARAIENQAYVIGVNRCGADPNVAYSGRSLIIDPRGAILLDAGSAETVFGAVPDLAALLDYRARFPALADMREDYLRG